MDMSWATRQEAARPFNEQVRCEYVEQMVIDGEKATLKLYNTGNFDSGKISIIDQNGVKKIIEEETRYDQEEANYNALFHFIECLETGKPFQTSAEYNLTTLRMISDVYKSASQHTSVLL